MAVRILSVSFIREENDVRFCVHFQSGISFDYHLLFSIRKQKKMHIHNYTYDKHREFKINFDTNASTTLLFDTHLCINIWFLKLHSYPICRVKPLVYSYIENKFSRWRLCLDWLFFRVGITHENCYLKVVENRKQSWWRRTSSSAFRMLGGSVTRMEVIHEACNNTDCCTYCSKNPMMIQGHFVHRGRSWVSFSAHTGVSQISCINIQWLVKGFKNRCGHVYHIKLIPWLVVS